MKQEIQKLLARIEEEYGIKILYACETGSRAWGFPSPDSDYDIRMLYVHPKDWYLQLGSPADTIDRMFADRELDVSGWDLKKSLGLLWKSNAPLLERMQSPIVYKSDEQFLFEFKKIAETAYSPVAVMYHFLSMSKKFQEDLINNDEYKLKRLFYALRTATATKWILEKSTAPKIVFWEMIEELDINEGLRERIQFLIALKATKNEDYIHSKEPLIENFIAQCIKNAEIGSKSLKGGNKDIEAMNTHFLNTLNRYEEL